MKGLCFFLKQMVMLFSIFMMYEKRTEDIFFLAVVIKDG